MSAKSSEKEKCMYPSIMKSSLWIGFETLNIEQEFKYVISSKGILKYYFIYYKIKLPNCPLKIFFINLTKS